MTNDDELNFRHDVPTLKRWDVDNTVTVIRGHDAIRTSGRCDGDGDDVGPIRGELVHWATSCRACDPCDGMTCIIFNARAILYATGDV